MVTSMGVVVLLRVGRPPTEVYFMVESKQLGLLSRTEGAHYFFPFVQ